MDNNAKGRMSSPAFCPFPRSHSPLEVVEFFKRISSRSACFLRSCSLRSCFRCPHTPRRQISEYVLSTFTSSTRSIDASCVAPRIARRTNDHRRNKKVGHRTRPFSFLILNFKLIRTRTPRRSRPSRSSVRRNSLMSRPRCWWKTHTWVCWPDTARRW